MAEDKNQPKADRPRAEDNEQQDRKSHGDHHERNAIIITAAITLLAVAFIGGLIYFGKNYRQHQKDLETLRTELENSQNSAENPGEVLISGEAAADAVATATKSAAGTDEYAGWKTYTNSEIGYTLKYPSDWTVKEKNEISQILETPLKNITIASPDKNYFLLWGLRRKGDSFGILDRTGIGAGTPKKSGKITILGKEYDINLFVIQGKTEEIFYPNAGIAESADGKYEFVANFEENFDAESNLPDMSTAPQRLLAEKILKSISLISPQGGTGCAQNFTNEESLTKTGWKTFTNSKHGYSFEYPENWTVGEKQSDYTGLGSGADQQSFEWRSDLMTGTDYYGFKEDRSKNMSVGCQKAKITYFSGDPAADPPGDAQDRLILVEFEKDNIPHVILFSYQYIGASISGDVVEMFELIMKTVKFSK